MATILLVAALIVLVQLFVTLTQEFYEYIRAKEALVASR